MRGGDPLKRIVVVLHEPQDLVNVALVVRAMSNMGLHRLRVVRPAEAFDPYRIEGIAHDTSDIVAGIRLLDTLDDALTDAACVLGTSARRRAERVAWWSPEEAAGRILERARSGTVALLFGREDKGLSNEDLDRCHAVVSIPADPEHPSLNLGHAAAILFYELRKAALLAGLAEARQMPPKRRREAPPATSAEMAAFFQVWEDAMSEVGLFHGVDPGSKMRSFRRLFLRADPDRRELGLLQAAAYEVLHYVRREAARLRQEVEGECGGRSGRQGR